MQLGRDKRRAQTRLTRLLGRNFELGPISESLTTPYLTGRKRIAAGLPPRDSAVMCGVDENVMGGRDLESVFWASTPGLEPLCTAYCCG